MRDQRKSKLSSGQFKYRDFTSGVTSTSQSIRDEMIKNKDILRQRLRSFVTALLVMLVGGVLFTIYSSRISSVAVNLDKSVVSKESTLISTVNDYFDQHGTQRFTVLLSESSLRSFIAQKHADIGDISFAKKLYSPTLRIDVSSRVTVAYLEQQKGYLALDATGLAHSRLSEKPDSEAVVIRDDSGLATNVGDTQVLPSLIRFTMAFTAANNAVPKDKRLMIERYIIPSQSREVYVQVKDAPLLYMLLTQDPDALLLDAIDAIDFTRSSGASMSEYIDLRTDGRAVY